MVDFEILRIIYHQIEGLSNAGDHEQAELLKEFIEEEFTAGSVSTEIKFYGVFNNWKNDEKRKVIYELSEEWGIYSNIFEKSVEAYSSRKPEDVPYIVDLTSTLDFSSAKNPIGDTQLKHFMELTGKLKKVIHKIKVKYD